ncbi:MAG: methylmalonyl-CoA epimerase [candidate division Zixibacteria bacterium]
MKILGLHHVAVAVDDIEKYRSIFENLLDIKCGPVETDEANGVSLTFLDLQNSELEFVKPLDDGSSIAKFIAKRGSGIHHFCLRVEDIDTAIEELKSKNVQMIDNKPRAGAGGSKIAFIHPESAGGILIELKQDNVSKE